MSQTLVAVGAFIIVIAAAIHWVIKGVTLFPHASLILAIVGVVIAAVGALMMVMRGRSAS